MFIALPHDAREQTGHATKFTGCGKVALRSMARATQNWEIFMWSANFWIADSQTHALWILICGCTKVHEAQAQSCVNILSNALDARVAALLASPLIPYFEEAASGLSRIVVLAWRFVA